MIQFVASQFHRTRWHSLLHCCALLVITLCASAAAFAQVNVVSGACPASCGIKIKITSATLTEANDGMLVNVEWTLEQTAPEIKLKNLTVFANVDLGLDNVKNSVNVSVATRQTTFKLSRRVEFDLRDVKVLTTKVTAFADALPSIPVTNITSRKVIEDGRDSAVEVTWGDPGPLPCSANVFQVNVAATNEKNDRLTGITTTPPSARKAKAEVKGDTNKKGLHNPEATIKLLNNLIECSDSKANSNPVAVAPRDTSGQTKVTVKDITFQVTGDRVDPTVTWEVVEPTGFKATSFNLKFESENAAGQIGTLTKSVAGGTRSALGRQVAAADLRSLTVTITATFKDNANTTVLTREDKKTQTFNLKQATKPVAQIPSTVPPPPAPQNVSLNIIGVKINSEGEAHIVTVGWEVKVPSGVTITGFEVDAKAVGSQKQAQRSVAVSGEAVKATINFTSAEVGNQLNKVQVKVIANARRADGSTFQQTATAEGQPVVPPPLPPPPPVQLKVKSLSSIITGSNFFVNGSWFIDVQAGITIQSFVVEAAILKPTGPIRKTVKAGSDSRDQSVTFTTAEASGATAVEMKVIANLRRADGTTFQETSVRQTNVGN